jgi:hypothetical protein
MYTASTLCSAFLFHCHEAFPFGWRALASGTFSMAAGLSVSSRTFVAGHITTNAGYRISFPTASVRTAAGAGLFWATSLLLKGEASPAL